MQEADMLTKLGQRAKQHHGVCKRGRGSRSSDGRLSMPIGVQTGSFVTGRNIDH